jgi:histidine decarboxylase
MRDVGTTKSPTEGEVTVNDHPINLTAVPGADSKPGGARPRRWLRTNDVRTDRDVAALTCRLARARSRNIGFPGSADFDFTPLAPLLTRQLLNNLGDPAIDGTYPNHTKPMEREVVDTIANILHAPTDDRTGHITSGSTEGTLFALERARAKYPRAVVMHSDASHYSVAKAARILAMPSVVVATTELGEMDYTDLGRKVAEHRHRAIVLVANIGTTMTEAVDNLHQVTAVLDAAGVHRRWIHADGALAGLPLALLAPDTRPGVDLGDGADSMIISGHKFPGCPMPCGVVVLRRSLCGAGASTVAYTGSPDSTISGSRSGGAALVLWYGLRKHGIDGLRRRAERSRALAAYLHQRLEAMGWACLRNPLAFTVALKTPPGDVAERWMLPTEDGWSHVVCMPGVTRPQVDAFLRDVAKALNPDGAAVSRVLSSSAWATRSDDPGSVGMGERASA